MKTLETKIEEMKRDMESRIKRAEGAREAFKKDLDKDMFYAMEWGNKMFNAAAMHRVATQILTILSTVKTEDEWNGLRKFILDKTLWGARCPTQSTSPAANLISVRETAEWADILDGYFKN